MFPPRRCRAPRIVVPLRAINGGMYYKFETDASRGVELCGLLTPDQYTQAITNINERLKPTRQGIVDGALLATHLLILPMAIYGIRDQLRKQRRRKLLKVAVEEFEEQYPNLQLQCHGRLPLSFLTIERRQQSSREGTAAWTSSDNHNDLVEAEAELVSTLPPQVREQRLFEANHSSVTATEPVATPVATLFPEPKHLPHFYNQARPIMASAELATEDIRPIHVVAQTTGRPSNDAARATTGHSTEHQQRQRKVAPKHRPTHNASSQSRNPRQHVSQRQTTMRAAAGVADSSNVMAPHSDASSSATAPPQTAPPSTNRPRSRHRPRRVKSYSSSEFPSSAAVYPPVQRQRLQQQQKRHPAPTLDSEGRMQRPRLRQPISRDPVDPFRLAATSRQRLPPPPPTVDAAMAGQGSQSRAPTRNRRGESTFPRRLPPPPPTIDTVIESPFVYASNEPIATAELVG